jgi:hypothetical protein
MIPICNIYMIDVLWHDIINFICIYKYIIIEADLKMILIVLTLVFVIQRSPYPAHLQWNSFAYKCKSQPSKHN